MKKNWNSLSDVKRFLESTKKEKIVKFNGYQLVTDKADYGLYMGELRRTEHPNQKPVRKSKPRRK